eukprot:scaffold8013_cov124-Isochrysis_galbana.AAC.8
MPRLPSALGLSGAKAKRKHILRYDTLHLAAFAQFAPCYIYISIVGFAYVLFYHNARDGAPNDARSLAPPHAGPLGRHTLILTTPSSPQHLDCFRCLAAPPRERAKPGGLSCQRNAQLQEY